MEYAIVLPPNYIDKFWEVREIIAEGIANMDKEFIASDTCCLDKSMSEWVNQYFLSRFHLMPKKTMAARK